MCTSECIVCAEGRTRAEGWRGSVRQRRRSQRGSCRQTELTFSMPVTATVYFCLCSYSTVREERDQRSEGEVKRGRAVSEALAVSVREDGWRLTKAGLVGDDLVGQRLGL